jgi:hypothetical protein
MDKDKHLTSTMSDQNMKRSRMGQESSKSRENDIGECPFSNTKHHLLNAVHICKLFEITALFQQTCIN